MEAVANTFTQRQSALTRYSARIVLIIVIVKIVLIIVKNDTTVASDKYQLLGHNVFKSPTTIIKYAKRRNDESDKKYKHRLLIRNRKGTV